MTSTPQKNHSSHFDNAYSDGNTPQKVLDNVDVLPSHVLRERNRKSDIFNRDAGADAEQPCQTIRSNDAGNDAACAQFRMRQQKSNVFASEGEAGAVAPSQPPAAQGQKPYKISNVFG